MAHALDGRAEQVGLLKNKFLYKASLLTLFLLELRAVLVLGLYLGVKTLITGFSFSQ